MKYRRNKVKREHSIIHGALVWLEELTQSPEVTDIIPGVIEANRSPERGVVYKYETQTGCKLLLKSNGSIQEAFVVTKNPVWVKAWVKEHFPPSSCEAKGSEPLRQSAQSEAGAIGSRSEKREARPKKRINQVQRTKEKAMLSEKKTPSRVQKRKGVSPSRQSQGAESGAAAETPDAPNLGEQISPQMRKALRQLQKDLGVQGKGQKRQR